MGSKIPSDIDRFKEIVKGKRPKGFEGVIGKGGFKFRKGKRIISVPQPQISLPKFSEKPEEPSGIGQGPGEPGDTLGPYQAPGDDEGQGEAGDKPGEHGLEEDVSLEELMRQFGEELELQNMRKTESGTIYEIITKWTGVRKHGKKVLFKRSFKNALKRTLSEMGELPKPDEFIIPIIEKPDKLYRGPKYIFKPITRAAIFYMMDISGSMEPTKDIARTEAFWIDAWIRYQYGDKNVMSRYLVHDTSAKEVSALEFFRQSTGGGTKISSAFELSTNIIKKELQPVESWNIYLFHFTDGDNWNNDNEDVIDLIEEYLVNVSNQISIIQVESPYGSGKFGKEIENYFGDNHDKIMVSYISTQEDIAKSLKQLLGKDSNKTAIIRESDALIRPKHAMLGMDATGIYLDFNSRREFIATNKGGVLVPTNISSSELDYWLR